MNGHSLRARFTKELLDMWIFPHMNGQVLHARYGDTMWVGKVRAITPETGVLFDPAQYDPDELPAGMEIVSLGGTKYLQAVLNGWSSFIPVDPINATAAYSHFSTDVKYAVGSSGFPLNKINTFLKAGNC